MMLELKQVLKDAFGFLNLNIEYKREDAFKKYLRSRLSNLSDPLLIDIGANNGDFAAYFLATKDIQVISFEPIELCNKHLLQRSQNYPNWTISPPFLALSNSSGFSAFYVSENLVSSSLLAVNNIHTSAAPKSTVCDLLQVETTTLDKYLKPHAYLGKSIVLKIDVQGHELNVLMGSENILKEAKLVAIEVSFEELYDGSSTFGEIYSYMITRGFSLCTAYEAFNDNKSGKCLQLDAIFEKQI